MRASLLSILVPLYNEEEFIEPLLERVLALPAGLARDIIGVDDGSTDKPYFCRGVTPRLKLSCGM